MLVVGCGTASEVETPLEPREPAPLVLPDAWALVPPAEDVYVRRRPSSVRCEAELGYRNDLYAGVPAFEVDTAWCNFITVRQPARVDLRADEILDLRLWHFELVADAPAEAFLGLAIDGEEVWERRVAIPGQPALEAAIIELARDYPEGVEVQFHLDNHGENNYVLLNIDREAEDPELGEG